MNEASGIWNSIHYPYRFTEEISPANISSNISPSKISPVNNNAVGCVVARAPYTIARVSCSSEWHKRRYMCHRTALVGVLVKIALHVQHHEGRCTLYIGERAARARAFRLSLLVVSLSLCVSLSRRVSSLPAFCFRFAGSRVLHSSLLSTILLAIFCWQYFFRTPSLSSLE